MGDHDSERRSDTGHDYLTGIDEVPITVQHAPPAGIAVLGNAGEPRATVAASKEYPKGSPDSPQDLTVLQQHVRFFDTDGDGIITFIDTYRGLRRLGLMFPIAIFGTLVFHFFFGPATQPHWIPSPFLNIYTSRIHRGKHGSDTESYDTEGRFVPQKFEEIFSKYDTHRHGYLTIWETWQMVNGNRNNADLIGFLAGMAKWILMFIIAGKHNKLYKEDVRMVFDGTLFFRIAEENEQKQRHRSHFHSVGSFGVKGRME